MTQLKRVAAFFTAIAATGTLASVPAFALSDGMTVPAGEPSEIALSETDPEEIFSTTIFGDVNYDKLIGIADAVQLQRYLLGQTEELGHWWNADLNQDGVINAYDFTLLKQQITGLGTKGGSAIINVVDTMTGAPVEGAHVTLYSICNDQYCYMLGEWDSDADAVMYFSGLPTGAEYTYFMDCTAGPEAYDTEWGFGWVQSDFKFDEGQTNKAVNLYLTKKDAEPNVMIGQYDWAMELDVLRELNYGYGRVAVYDEDGSMIYRNVNSFGCALPDGNYHAEITMYEHEGNRVPARVLEPDSDFAKHIKELHPDAVLTDTTGGIDFTVKDGKPDRELFFEMEPLPDRSNSITVHCVDGETGEPVEGVALSLIEAPGSYAKKVAEWVSDETGTHVFDGLLHTGYARTNAYEIALDALPEGYTGGFNEKVNYGYVNFDNRDVTMTFYKTDAPKNFSFDILNVSDGSAAEIPVSCEVWRITSDDGDSICIYDNAKLGEKLALADGSYFAALNGRQLLDAGYGYAVDAPDADYLTASGIIEFKVKDGALSKDLHFYVEKYVSSADLD